MLAPYNPRIVRYDYILGKRPEGAVHLGITASVDCRETTHSLHTVHALAGTPKAISQLEGRLALTSDTCRQAEREFQLIREAEENKEFSGLFGSPIRILDIPLKLELISMTGGLREDDGQLLKNGFESLKEAATGTLQRSRRGKYIKVKGYSVEASSAQAYTRCTGYLKQINNILEEKIRTFKGLCDLETGITKTNIYLEEFSLSSVSRNPERL